MKGILVLNDKAIVSSKGQVVIPKIFRKTFGIHAGTELIFEAENNTVMIVKPVRRNIKCFLVVANQAIKLLYRWKRWIKLLGRQFQ